MIRFKKVKENNKELTHTDVFFDKEYIGYIIEGDFYNNKPYYFVNDGNKELLSNSGTLTELYKYIFAYGEERIRAKQFNKSSNIHVIYDACHYGYIVLSESLLDERYIKLHVFHSSPLKGALTIHTGDILLLNILYIDDLKSATVKDIESFYHYAPPNYDELNNAILFKNYIDSLILNKS